MRNAISIFGRFMARVEVEMIHFGEIKLILKKYLKNLRNSQKSTTFATK